MTTLEDKETMKKASVVISSIVILIFLCAVCPHSLNAARKNKPQKRPKIGLVLGGGGAKGAAEIGVLKYIEEANIPIDYIAGTSIGSIIGGLYSVGYRHAELDSLFHSQQWMDLLTDRNSSVASHPYKVRDSVAYVFGFPIHNRHKVKDKSRKHTFGVVLGDSVQSLLEETSRCHDSISFDKLPIPFRCVAVDIRTMEEIVFSQGSLPLAMRASMSIPGAYKPVVKDSMLLVDGGMLNNLPVDVVKAMGADIVIAVDLTQNKREKYENKEIKKMKSLSADEYSQFSRIIAWVKERPDLIKYRVNSKAADIYINPDLKGFSAADFHQKKIDEMILRGEQAGKDALPKLRALSKKLHKR